MLALGLLTAAVTYVLLTTVPSPSTLTALTRLPTATATLSLPGPTVADLLKAPPAAGQRVEVDAYFSGATAPPMPGPPPAPDQVNCPTTWSAALTDRPFLATLAILNGLRSNTLPDDAPWLIAVSPEAMQPGRSEQAQLPYLARLRGYLGEPAFHHCDHADRFFVVEQVVTVYQPQPPEPPLDQQKAPADLADWPRYHNADFGYSLPLAADCKVEPQAASGDVLSDVALSGAKWQAFPLNIRVHAGPLNYDPYNPAQLPPLLQGNGFGVFEQAFVYADAGQQSGGLAGYEVDRAPGESAVLFSDSQRTYELVFRYPTGFEADQTLLTTLTAMIYGFRLDQSPGPTSTPPVKQTLGAGPFLTEAEALAKVRTQNDATPELIEGQLVTEAAARDLNGPCSSFAGHPDGVWLLTVRGEFEGQTRTMRVYLNATTGDQLCGEEVTAPTGGVR